jgi:hypothetical protein
MQAFYLTCKHYVIQPAFILLPSIFSAAILFLATMFIFGSISKKVERFYLLSSVDLTNFGLER